MQQSSIYKFPRGPYDPTKREVQEQRQRSRDTIELRRRCASKGQGSELDRSVMPSHVQHKKMSRESFEQNESNIDRIGHCKSILLELLPKKDGSFSNGVKELPSTKTQNKDKHGLVLSGLARNDRKRLKHTLNEIITFINAEVDEVDRDVQAMVECGEIRQDNGKELSAELLGKLSKMAQSVEDLLNTAASRCRPMTTEEKIELGKRIRMLPEEALNRAVEIVTAGKPESQSSEKITMNLRELDDTVLWRLHYHVEYVLKENNV